MRNDTGRRRQPRLPKWSEAELLDLCEIALLAWQHASGNARKAQFTWRGRSFYATHSTFAVRVYTTGWQYVAGMYD